LAEQSLGRGRGLASRLLETLTPTELEDGPPAGRWRQIQAGRPRQKLFADYLVAMGNEEADWQMLDQVIAMARQDGDRLLGLHVVSSQAKQDSPRLQRMQARFEQRCREGGVSGEFAVEAGQVVDTIVSRSVLADLVVLGLNHPPGTQALSRLGNRFSKLVQRSPRPILAVPSGAACAMDRLLLAFDGSPKAEEALFVAAYLKSRWSYALTVVTVETAYTSAAAQERARAYLEQQGITDAQYVLRPKPIAEAILATAVAHDSNFLVMGGFGFRPMMHFVLGSTVDQILREFHCPILICR
jgi:nucleotide-binding universal stress UspA family protein